VRGGQGGCTGLALIPSGSCIVGGATACRRRAGARALGQGEGDTEGEREMLGLLGWASALCTWVQSSLGLFLFLFCFSLFIFLF
jgi:hypothetical protein